MTAPLQIGFSEISLTPEKTVRLAGQFAERLSQGIEKPVTATAMAVSAGDEHFVLCSCDLVSVSEPLLAAVRARLGETTPGLDPCKAILSATHTHTSLLYQGTGTTRALDILRRYLPEDSRYVENAATTKDVMEATEAFEFLAERIAMALRDAWRARKPAAYANAFGRAAVGLCRRVVFNDGSAAMWGDTNQATFAHLEGGNDSGLELLYVFDTQKKLTGVVANVACPAQCVQHRLFVSPDYWGEVKQNLRRHFGDDLFVVGLCAAAGDQCPVDLVRWVDPESPVDDPNISRPHPLRRRADPSMFDLAGMRKVGRRIANEIVEVYEEARGSLRETAVLRHRRISLDLPVRRVTPEQYRTALQALEAFKRDHDKTVDYRDNARMHVHAGTLARYEFQQEHDLHTIESHIVRWDDLAIATNPFELFLDYGNQIRSRSPAAQTFLVQLACGSDGYLPSARAERGGHYSAYVSSGIVGHEGGDLLVRTTLSRIKDLWRE